MITGASGMLGAALMDDWSKKYDTYAVVGKSFKDHNYKKYLAFDFLSDDYSLLSDWCNPDVVVHCAAVTSMEACERNPQMAFTINGESVKNLIDTFPKSKIIFISSDAVYPKESHNSTEKTPTQPETIYGESKCLGESYILKSQNHSAIRTTIVGKNMNKSKESFAEWIVNSIRNGNEITLFEDVLFSPITIWDLGEALEWVIGHSSPPVLNISGKGNLTKYQFGHNLAKKLGLQTHRIKKGKLSDLTTPIRRYNDMTISSHLYEELSGNQLPTPEQTLQILAERFKNT